MSIPADLAQEWLIWQCQVVSGIIRGMVFAIDDDGSLGEVIASHPESGEGRSLMKDYAYSALKEGKGLVKIRQKYGPSDERLCDLVACPILIDGKPVAVMSMIMAVRSEQQLHTLLKLVQWSGLWMKTLASVHQQRSKKRNTGIFFLTLARSIHEQPSTQAAAMDMANQLADQFACERVSIGFREGLSIRLQAFSHVATFDARTQLVRGIEAAMEEALDQQAAILLPLQAEDDALITRAHEELLTHSEQSEVCSIPLPGRNGNFGAITLERNGNQPLDKDELALLQSQASFMGPAMELKLWEERPLWIKGLDIIEEWSSSLMGPNHLKAKVVSVSALVLLTALIFISGTHEVTAPASIEGAVRQIVIAPLNGYIKQAPAIAGDKVKKGQLIAKLDDRNLQLELQKQLSERNKIEKEYQQALAGRDRVELGILRAKIDQVSAEIGLIEGKIADTELLAPYDGIVISGDLSQSIGKPVETGQALFEVAPLDNYRVVLEVEDHDMGGISAGKKGRLIIAALPQSSYSLSVEQVIPVAVSEAEKNFFRVEANLDKPPQQLLPGMRGVAKVEMGERSLLWIWTHGLVDRVRLWIWSIGL